MDAWMWIVLVAVAVIVAAGAFVMARRARRSGSVLAAGTEREAQR